MTKMIGVRVPADSDLPERLRALSDKTGLSYYKLLERWISESEMKPADEFSVDVFGLNSRLSALSVRVSDNYSDLDKSILAFVARFSTDFSDLDSKVSSLVSRVASLEEMARPDRASLNEVMDEILNDFDGVSMVVSDDKQEVKQEVKPKIEKGVKAKVGKDIKRKAEKDVKLVASPDVESKVEQEVKLDVKQASDVDKSVVIARIMELRFKGLSFAVIAKRLEEEGVPTLRGGRWHSGTIAKLLR
jgi:hypothetical protein